MRGVLDTLRELPDYKAFLGRAGQPHGRLVLTDVPYSALALLVAALKEDLGVPILFLVPNLREAESELRRIHAFLGMETTILPEEAGLFLLPSYHLTLHDTVAHDPQSVADRLRALSALGSGRAVVMVGTPDGALQPTVSPQFLKERQRRILLHDEIDREELLDYLSRLFYRRTATVERPGEFSIRGGILDLFPPTSSLPIRLEFFGDEVESIREFDPGDQCSRGEVVEANLGLASEVGPLLGPLENGAQGFSPACGVPLVSPGSLALADLKARPTRRRVRCAQQKGASVFSLDGLPVGRICATPPQRGDHQEAISNIPHSATALSHLPRDSLILLSDPLRLKAEYAAFQAELRQGCERASPGEKAPLPSVPPDLDWKRLVPSTQRLVSVGQAAEGGEPPAHLTVSLRGAGVQTYPNQVDLLVDDMKARLAAGGRVFFASKYGGRVREMLAEKELAGRWEVFDCPIQGGFVLGGGALVFLTDKEVFGWERVLRPLSAFQSVPSRPLFSVFDLRPGDLVVHINHGIGRFGGVVAKTVQNITNDYILINYAHGDRLFVPVTHLWRVQKYVGGEAAEPAIHPLRSSTWGASRARAKRHAEELAKEMLDLQARRQARSGFAFSPDSPWMEQVEASFPYEETEDQAAAIGQVKADMEMGKPMERLVCGEVGFGKTEVAIRAAFKAVVDGKQVAMLAPTTVLAQQHLATFSERLVPQAVVVQMLSRFQSPREQESILRGLRQGSVDVMIGTHRLLQSDVQFRDLGLLVIDEEQRFGVRQKEKLKKFKETVDVLTLSATPIPRTLYMALSGIRDMSLVNDPPVGRLAVKTYVVEEGEALIRDAILRELERGGQVYFVHNRVETIGHAFHRLSSLLPSVRIRMAHGQMPEVELEPVVADFLNHKFDVLLCTTIIENGLDIPNANTLIVRDAERLGLAQMYQLRGRVGRSNRQAYAYFLYRRPERLSRLSLERLQAIKEMSELGAGLRLALRDLEIRGAGNLLGEEQHGHIEALGFELYCQLLEDAVREIRGEPVPRRRSLPSLDLPLDIRLPHHYIPEETDRLQFYRRFAAAADSSEVEELVREMIDRFGPPPETASNLVEVVRVRSLCLAKGVAKVTLSDGTALLEADHSAYPGQRGRVKLHIRSKNGRIILERLREALSLLPDVP